MPSSSRSPTEPEEALWDDDGQWWLVRRGLSRCVAEALEHEARRQALRNCLDDQDREHGPIPDDLMQEVRRRWLGADRATS